MPMESCLPGVGKWSSEREWSGACRLAEQTEACAGHAIIPRGFLELPGEGSLEKGWTSHSQVNWRDKIMNISETFQKREAGTLKVAREN